jgi:ribonuclease-3
MDNNSSSDDETIIPTQTDDYLIIKKQIEDDLATHDFSESHITREDIENVLNFKIKNINHYLRALVHKSIYKAIKKYTGPKPLQEYLRQHNERLEFLGDSVLGFIVANYLFHKYPDKDEGFLTKLKTKIVNSSQLATLAKKVNLGNLILMSNHVQNIGGRNSQKILEDAFEAFLAAIFKDLGFEAVNHFMVTLIESLDFDELLLEDNYKDILLRYTQNLSKTCIAKYDVVGIEGPAHNREFIVAVNIDGVIHSEGKAKSKKRAEQIAAEKTLKKLNIIN